MLVPARLDYRDLGNPGANTVNAFSGANNVSGQIPKGLSALVNLQELCAFFLHIFNQ